MARPRLRHQGGESDTPASVRLTLTPPGTSPSHARIAAPKEPAAGPNLLEAPAAGPSLLVHTATALLVYPCAARLSARSPEGGTRSGEPRVDARTAARN